MCPRELFTPTFTSPPSGVALAIIKLLILLARRKGFEPLTPKFEVCAVFRSGNRWVATEIELRTG